MRLTWKDGAASLLAAAMASVYAAYSLGWSWPLVGDVRWATLAVGALGLGMCIVGAAPTSMTSRSRYAVLASVLGITALALVVIGLITALPITLGLLALDIVLLYVIATVRHAVTGAPVPRAV